MRQTNLAHNLSLIQELDPRRNSPERIIEQINDALKRGNLTLKDISRFTTFSTSVISTHLNGKYEGDTAKVDAALSRFFMNYISKHSIIETTAAKEIQTLLAWAHRQRRIAIIVGDCGRGKTTAVQAYCAQHADETAYVCLDATSRLIEFLDTLAKALKIENQMSGPASFRKDAIIRALQRREKPMLILIDESDEIKPRILSTVRTIWGDDGRCAIALIGTGKLEQTLQREKELRYLDTRISLRLNVSEMMDADAIKLADRYPHNLERAEVRELVNWANRSSRNRGGIRALSHLMQNAFDLMNAADQDEITMEIIEEAKGYM